MTICSVLVALMSGCTSPMAPGADDLLAGEISAATLRPPVLITQPVSARAADDLVNSIGVNTHLSYFRTPYGTGWESIIRPKLLALGVRHARDAGTTHQDDKWMSIVYGRMKELADGGVKFNLIMKPAEGTSEYQSLPQFDRLMQYAGPAVESFEGLNEHDLSKRPGWVDEVRSFQKALFQQVRNDSRTRMMPVIGPSIGHPVNGPQLGNLSSWMTLGNIHPYPGGLEPLQNIADHDGKVNRTVGMSRYVVTETGYHTASQWNGPHPGVSEEAMGRYTLRLFVEYFASGIPLTYLYEFIDEGVDPTDREKNFGLLRADGTEKPAYTGLRNMISLLADPGKDFTCGSLAYGLSGAVGNIKQLLLQKRDGRFYLVLWQPARIYDIASKAKTEPKPRMVTVDLDRPAASIKVFVPLEGSSPIFQASGKDAIDVAVPDTPVFVEIQP